MSRKSETGHLYEMGKQISELEDQAWSGEVEAELKKRWGRSFTAWLPLIWNSQWILTCAQRCAAITWMWLPVQ